MRRLRTSIRRLVSLIDAAQAVAPRRALAAQRRRLQAQLRSLGVLRDADITRSFIVERQKDNPSLALFAEELRARRGALAARAAAGLAAFDQQPLEKTLSYAADHLRGQTQERAAARFTGFLGGTLSGILRARARSSPDDLGSIHRLRIAFKKLRYAAEALNALLADFSRNDLEAMHGFHSLMGQIQDLSVIAAGIERFGGSRNRVVRDELRPVVREIREEQRVLIETLDQAAEQALDYWMKQLAIS